jgi:hypothetical protein
LSCTARHGSHDATLRRQSLAFLLMVGAAVLAPRAAHADVTSWLALGGGYSLEHTPVPLATDRNTMLSYSIGVGTTPQANWVVGGIFRATPLLTRGTDIGLAARFATGGFARGDWGGALDVGVVGRFWNDGADGDYPLRFVGTFGAPWGLLLAVGADVWSISGGTPARGVFALFEIDLLRLTVMRQGSTNGPWYNPSPAGGAVEPQK